MIIFNTISLDSILISNKRFLTWYDIAQNIANLIAIYLNSRIYRMLLIR